MKKFIFILSVIFTLNTTFLYAKDSSEKVEVEMSIYVQSKFTQNFLKPL